MFTEEFLKEQKEKLKKEKERLEKELGTIGQKSETSDEDYDVEFESYGNVITEPDEQAAEYTDFEQRKAAETNLEDLLHQVNRALKKIEDGSYGLDQNGQPISRERLAAIPWATTSINEPE